MGFTLTLDKEQSPAHLYFLYYHKGKRTKIYTQVRCKKNHFNVEKRKITRADSEYLSKNIILDSKLSVLKDIERRQKINGEELTIPLLKSLIRQKGLTQKNDTSKKVHLLILLEEYKAQYLKDQRKEKSTKKGFKSKIGELIRFVRSYENNNSTQLLIDDIDTNFIDEFISWCYNKGHQPSTVKRHFIHLRAFCNWYSNKYKHHIKIETPVELRESISRSTKDIIYLNETEFNKIWSWDKFNYWGVKTDENGKPIRDSKNRVLFNEKHNWKKWLALQTDGREEYKNKHGVVEIIDDRIDLDNDGSYSYSRKYTSWEVYQDMLLFLCSVGCRFSDLVKIKVGDFQHSKRDRNNLSEVEGYFEIWQKKTRRPATPRVNHLSLSIYKKYSYGKHREDYLFPRTKSGNPMSVQKFNIHIKNICKVIGLNRKVKNPVFTVGGKIVDGTEERVPLYKVISSHIGRRTFIKTLVLDKKYPERYIMNQSGHKSSHIFNKYYEIEPEDIQKVSSNAFKRADVPDTAKKPIDEEKLLKYYEMYEKGLLTAEEFERLKKGVI